MKISRQKGFPTEGAGWGRLAVWLALALFPVSLWSQYRESQEAEPRLVADDYSAVMESQPEPIEVQHYVIDAELLPETHEIRAKAQIRFLARESLSDIQLELNSNLFPTNITDGEGEVLSSRRIGRGETLEVSLRERLDRDEAGTLVLEYAGPLADAEYSPVEGVQLAYIGEEISYLLYPARWFPVSGYRVNRYTAEFHLTVPAGYQIVSGGSMQSQLDGSNIIYTVIFDRPQFPGSLAVVRQSPHTINTADANVRVYFSPEHQGVVHAYAEAAAHMVSFFSEKFGPPAGANLSIVEISDNSLGGYAGSETVFLAPRAIGNEVNVGLLAQEIAQQWWRGLVGPATKADLWLDHGLATYSEALYLEELGGPEAIEARIREMAIDALTRDTIPVRAASRMPEFSPAYKTLLYDKAAYVMHMLRWVVGDDAFFAGLKEFTRRYGYQEATTEDFRRVMEQISGQKLEGFFLQWFDSTGASDFTLDYTVYRTREGFRIAGEISQDKDLFSMPVEVLVETEGEPVTTRVEVAGRSSEFSISTLERPTRMVVDPNNRVLKYNDRIRVRVAIARGEQAVAERDYTQALEEYQQAIDVNRISSLAHYRVGEVFFALRNYQSAANAFREALNGDLDPSWTEVWSHIYLGKIFDVTGQRERAINAYQQAIRTKDDTQGAIEQANQYLKQPYERTSQQADTGG
ncbi:MAG: tetratricopeptide repeat protein [Acidobacteria bacterium]|nr:tetratricopeptide repeat protein [Acidobacteriota bacterium]